MGNVNRELRTCQSDRVTFDRWKRITEWPLTVLALLFLSAYAWSVIGDLTGPRAHLTDWVMNGVWFLFAAEFAVSLALAPNRGRWFVRHFHEFLMVALPFLRPLRLLRLVTLVTLLHRRAGAAFRGRVTIFVVAASSLLVFIASLAELDAEQNAAGANIRSFGDSLWWAFVTITTVGYGDFYPVTLVGRLVAVGLMIAGIALIGTVTATFASWFVESIASAKAEDKAVAEKSRELSGQVSETANRP